MNTDTVTCPDCDLTYAPGVADDCKEHDTRHQQWVAATSAIEYRPEGYVAREDSKVRGWRLAREGETADERLIGAELVLRAHFDRSLHAAITRGEHAGHPEFGRYVRMRELSFDSEINELLRQRYGAYLGGCIPQGESYWMSTSDS